MKFTAILFLFLAALGRSTSSKKTIDVEDWLADRSVPEQGRQLLLDHLHYNAGMNFTPADLERFGLEYGPDRWGEYFDEES
jgi:hypothetical protein